MWHAVQSLSSQRHALLCVKGPLGGEPGVGKEAGRQAGAFSGCLPGTQAFYMPKRQQPSPAQPRGSSFLFQSCVICQISEVSGHKRATPQMGKSAQRLNQQVSAWFILSGHCMIRQCASTGAWMDIATTCLSFLPSTHPIRKQCLALSPSHAMSFVEQRRWWSKGGQLWRAIWLASWSELWTRT